MSYRTGFLVATLLALVTFAVSSAQSTNPTPHAGTKIYAPLLRVPDASSQTPEQRAIAQQVLDLVNAERRRANASCPLLTLNTALTNAAQGHSQSMATANFFDHTSPSGDDPFERARAAGYRGSIAENIAAGHSTAAGVMRDWMNSSGHRTNILNCNYREIGIGYYYQADDQGDVDLGDNTQGNPVYGGPFYYYWTQVFGRP
jgi:uncharacterized protein YkwD